MERVYGFGRLKEFDERSRNFPSRKLTRGFTPKTTYWKCAKVLDQGVQPYCVGFSWAHEIIANPVPVLTIDNNYAISLYHGAQQNDEWPGEDYDGSSVLGGWKYCRKLGWYSSVSWAFTLSDWILSTQLGPAVIGITWKTGMMEPDSNGFVHATGYTEGSHAILMNGYNLEGHYFTLHNSWGKSWGINGECKISESDIDKLRQDDAECAIITGRYDITKPPEPDPDDDDDDDDGFCHNLGAKLMRLVSAV
jgi:hypothetical protein